MGRAKGSSAAVAVLDLAAEGAFASVLGARRGTRGYARTVRVGPEELVALRDALERGGELTRDQSEQLQAAFERERGAVELRTLVSSMRHATPRALAGSLRSPVLALTRRLHDDDQAGELAGDVLGMIVQRGRRENAQAKALIDGLVGTIADGYREGRLPAERSRELGWLLRTRPAFDSARDALIARAQAGDEQASAAIAVIGRAGFAEHAAEPLRELAKQFVAAGTLAAPKPPDPVFQRAVAALPDGLFEQAKAELPQLKGFASFPALVRRHLLDSAVANLPAWDAAHPKHPLEAHPDHVERRRAEHEALELLHAEVPVREPALSTLLTAPDGPLHAVVIESLPDWDPPRPVRGKGRFARYGEHLGIGVYVYCEAEAVWYKRALHGRRLHEGIGKSPLANPKTALDSARKYIELIQTGRYEAKETLGRGYPKALAERDRQLAAQLTSS